MGTQSIINKLPEVIKCIIFDHVSYKLNYLVEYISDKFIGNPIDLYNKHINTQNVDFYHTNKLTKIKTPLHFIGLYCNESLPPQEISNKLQKILFTWNNDFPKLPYIKILSIRGYITEIPNFKGLLELNCSYCFRLTEIPNIIGLKKLICYNCPNLTEIPNIVGLQELDCSGCKEITEIPHIVGLQKLDCNECRNLTVIPNIVGLKSLYCYRCDKLTEIPHIKGLRILICSWCNNLIRIPNTKGFYVLDCSHCPNLA